MDTEQAIEICNGWLAHLDRTRERAKQMTQLAAKARKGPEQAKEARREMRRLQCSPKVYDGARLEPAVKHLIALTKKIASSTNSSKRADV